MSKIGATETYDPCFDFSWINNLKDANIIITKNLTDKVIDNIIANKDKIILHHTITGFGSTPIEPNVPMVPTQLNQLTRLIAKGFPISQIVIRIDPIIPTEFGLRIFNRLLELINENFPRLLNRIRISVIDMYPHVISRWKDQISDLGLELQKKYELPSEKFTCSKEQFNKVISIVEYRSDRFNFESCAEPNLVNNSKFIEQIGCVSKKDLDILGVESLLEGESRQRKTCLCPGNKVPIIKRKPGRCPHNCIYCYWKD